MKISLPLNKKKNSKRKTFVILKSEFCDVRMQFSDFLR